jgi:hypothetical protein
VRNMRGTERKNGLVYRKGRLVVPRQMRRVLLALAHEGDLQHSGVNATCRKLAGFYWPKMRETVTKWVEGCNCSGAKIHRRPDGVDKVWDSFTALQAMMVDFFVDTKEHAAGVQSERNILVMVDMATGYCRLAKTKDRSKIAVAMAIRDRWIADLGCPEIIYGDNEGALRSDLLDYLCESSWMAELVLFAPYQKSGAAKVERTILTMETKIRAALAAGDIEEDNSDEWLRRIEYAVNTEESEEMEGSRFELLYGVRPRTPIRAALPYALNITEAERRKWQQAYREQVNDDRVRRAMRRPRRKGHDAKNRAVDFEEGQPVWAKVSRKASKIAKDSRWKKAIFVRIRQGQRSAIIKRNGKELVVALSDIRRRNPERFDKPTEEEIRLAMVGPRVSPNKLQEEKEEKEGKTVEQNKPAQEESQEQKEEAKEEAKKEVAKEEEKANEFVEDKKEEDPGSDESKQEMKEETSEEEEFSEVAEGPEEDEKTARTWDLLLAREKGSGKVYAALNYRNEGKKLTIMKRVANKRPGYHTVWWKEDKQKCQMKRPGKSWRLWNCATKNWTIMKNFGACLSNKFQVSAAIDQQILRELGAT